METEYHRQIKQMSDTLVRQLKDGFAKEDNPLAQAEFVARISELEAENERWSEKYAALHARFAQQQTKLEQAETERGTP